MEELKNNLKKLRKKENYSQQKLAELLNITQQAYANYETGARNIPIETLIKIADLYKISLDFLVGRNSKRIDTLSDEEEKIIKNYNYLTEKNKGKVELFIDQLLDNQADIKEVI